MAAGETVNLLPHGSGGSTPSPSTIFCSGVAQLVERLAVNQLVAGSSPAPGAILGYV